MGFKWYLARTQPRTERMSADELNRDGLDTYCPRILSADPSNTAFDTPLFPGYLFVKLDPDTGGWPTLRPSHKLLGWVRLGGETASMPDELMDELIDQVESANSLGGLWEKFHQGQKVRVVSNNMDTMAEILEEPKTAQSRVKVLLNFMGRLVNAQVPYGNLRTVDERALEEAPRPRRTRGRGRWVRGFRPGLARAT